LSYTTKSAIRQVHSPFQNKFSTDSNLVFPFSIYGSCLHLFRLPPVTALIACIFPSTSCFVRQFLRKMWPIQLAFLHFISRTIFLSPFNLCIISFLTRSVQLIFYVPSPEPHSKTFHVFLIYFPKCQIFSTTNL